MGDRNPRRDCDPHVVAVVNANGGRYRIVAYNAGAVFANPIASAAPHYGLVVDKLVENGMGEDVWVPCNDDRSPDSGARYAKDHLLDILLGLRAPDPGDHIEPRDRLGRHFRCTWGPKVGTSYHDPEHPLSDKVYGEPYPLRQTLWAPSEWAARAIFQAMFGEAMTKLYAATTPTASSKMPTVGVRPCEDPDGAPNHPAMLDGR